MSKRSKFSDKNPKGGYSVKGVEMFTPGNWKDQEYNDQDMADLVNNFNQWQSGPKKMIDVPGVIGHEEEQPLLENTGIPKVASLEKAFLSKGPCEKCESTGKVFAEGKDTSCPWCNGTGQRTVVKGDFNELPASIADLINRRAYKKVSAEVYDDGKCPGVPAKGKMFRRIAFLG